MNHPLSGRRLGLLIVLVATAGPSSQPAEAQASAQTTERQIKRSGLGREALAGQVVAVLPLTHIIRDTALRDSVFVQPRTAILRWVDSTLGEVLLENAPEITWMLPPELRMVARKGVGMIPEPDRMGQSVMRSSKIETVPDPLRGNLRTLMALAGGRYAFIPASMAFGLDPEGVTTVTLYAVLADSRTGKVGWRATNALGTGASPADALRAAVLTFLPPPDGPP
jgi:hypothetical protein